MVGRTRNICSKDASKMLRKRYKTVLERFKNGTEVLTHVHLHVCVQNCISKSCSITPRVGRYLRAPKILSRFTFNSLPLLRIECFVPMDTTKTTVREIVRKLREPHFIQSLASCRCLHTCSTHVQSIQLLVSRTAIYSRVQ